MIGRVQDTETQRGVVGDKGIARGGFCGCSSEVGDDPDILGGVSVGSVIQGGGTHKGKASSIGEGDPSNRPCGSSAKGGATE